MKPLPDAVAETFELVLRTARLVTDDDFIHRKVLLKVMADVVEDGEFGANADDFAFRCLASACKALGVKDPYEKEKSRRNRAFLGLETAFRGHLETAEDRVTAAIALVLAGSLDATVLGRGDAEREIRRRLALPEPNDDRAALAAALRKAKRVLYVTDEAGEIVLDKLLIEELARTAKVTAVLAARPVLALATTEDARAVGLDKVAAVIDPGAPMLGLALERASNEFREDFARADVVIARGETHLETLWDCGRPVFFLLGVTCESVAKRLGVPVGANVAVAHAGEREPDREPAARGGGRPETSMPRARSPRLRQEEVGGENA